MQVEKVAPGGPLWNDVVLMYTRMAPDGARPASWITEQGGWPNYNVYAAVTERRRGPKLEGILLAWQGVNCALIDAVIEHEEQSGAGTRLATYAMGAAAEAGARAVIATVRPGEESDYLPLGFKKASRRYLAPVWNGTGSRKLVVMHAPLHASPPDAGMCLRHVWESYYKRDFEGCGFEPA